MKKILVSLVLATVLLLSAVVPTFAGSLTGLRGIYYNFNAAETEWALMVDWIGKPAFDVKANEFYSQKVKGQLETVGQVEERIQLKFNDLLVEDTKLSTFDADDPVRQDPPQLAPDEEIVIINNSEYVRYHKCYFKIHIYSLDNLVTPESELGFVTRFSIYPIEDNWW